MRKFLYNLICFLFLIPILSCSGIYKTSSSEVTVIIKNDRMVTLNIKSPSLPEKLKRIIDRFNTKRAYAQGGLMPPFISTIRVIVEASDINTIVKTANVAGEAEIVITLEVPNGTNRHFIVEALNSYGTILNRGETSTNLDGSPVTLVISMTKTGLFVDANNGNDTNDCRTPQTACKTLTTALTKTKGNEAIYVALGTYDYAINGESFPLDLPPGTALICDPVDFATIIDSTISAQPGPAISASQRNYVYGCHFQNSWPAINDNGNMITVDNIFVSSGNIGSCIGVQISSGSMVRNSVFENIYWPGCGTYGGIYITGGTPLIENNLIKNNLTGISVMSGNPRINLNIISCNSMSDLMSETNISFDATNNAWDHAPPQADNTGYCLNGIDICSAQTPLPQYSPYLPAVVGGCP